MKVSPFLAQRIEAYLSGKLSKEASEEFEREIRKEPLLRQALYWRLKVKGATWSHGRKLEAQALHRLHSRQAFQRRAISLAAAVLLLCGLSWQLWPSASSLDHFARYYQLPQAPETMTPFTTPEQKLSEAHARYNSQDFAAAARRYQSLLKTANTERTSEVYFYLGLCYLELNRAQEALSAWSHARYHREQADWYSALVLLKQKNTQAAKGILERIALTPYHFYHQQAKRLLADME